MSRRKALLVGAAILGVVAVTAAFLWPAPPRQVIISVSAPTGTKITGNYEVDGVKSPIDTESPTDFKVTGWSVTFSIQKDDQPGEMIVRIMREGHGYASTAAGSGGWVSGGFKSGKGLSRSEAFWVGNSQGNP